eukprot:725433-Karenia_brevis.AAC.1
MDMPSMRRTHQCQRPLFFLSYRVASGPYDIIYLKAELLKIHTGACSANDNVAHNGSQLGSVLDLDRMLVDSEVATETMLHFVPRKKVKLVHPMGKLWKYTLGWICDTQHGKRFGMEHDGKYYT